MATTVKKLRAMATHTSLKDAYASIELDPIRWEFMTACLSEYFCLDFVTPTASAGLAPPGASAAQTEPVGHSVHGSGRGGHRKERFSAEGDIPIGALLQKEGRLDSAHVVADDFSDLNLPLKLRPTHKHAVTTRCVELIAERQDSLKMDLLFAEAMGNQVTVIMGQMPLTKIQLRLALESAEHEAAGGAVLFDPPRWADAIWKKV
jgi:hypothetical protein